MKINEIETIKELKATHHPLKKDLNMINRTNRIHRTKKSTPKTRAVEKRIEGVELMGTSDWIEIWHDDQSRTI